MSLHIIDRVLNQHSGERLHIQKVCAGRYNILKPDNHVAINDTDGKPLVAITHLKKARDIAKVVVFR